MSECSVVLSRVAGGEGPVQLAVCKTEPGAHRKKSPSVTLSDLCGDEIVSAL
jgi:hypothetical protein